METNFQMLKKFKYNPPNRGFCTSEDMNMIVDHFHLKERSDVELQNLRDFVVLFYSEREDRAHDKKEMDEYMQLIDEMSALTGVIDFVKAERGLEV